MGARSRYPTGRQTAPLLEKAQIKTLRGTAESKRGKGVSLIWLPLVFPKRAAARVMFTYALRREMVEYNHFSEVGLAVPSATANDRDRTLSDDELKKVVLPYLLSSSGIPSQKKR